VWLRVYRQYGVQGLAGTEQGAALSSQQTPSGSSRRCWNCARRNIDVGTTQKLKRVLERDQPAGRGRATSTIGEV